MADVKYVFVHEDELRESMIEHKNHEAVCAVRDLAQLMKSQDKNVYCHLIQIANYLENI